MHIYTYMYTQAIHVRVALPSLHVHFVLYCWILIASQQIFQVETMAHLIVSDVVLCISVMQKDVDHMQNHFLAVEIHVIYCMQ